MHMRWSIIIVSITTIFEIVDPIRRRLIVFFRILHPPSSICDFKFRNFKCIFAILFSSTLEKFLDLEDTFRQKN